MMLYSLTEAVVVQLVEHAANPKYCVCGRPARNDAHHWNQHLEVLRLFFPLASCFVIQSPTLVLALLEAHRTWGRTRVWLGPY